MRLSTGRGSLKIRCSHPSIDTVWASQYPCRPSWSTASFGGFIFRLYVKTAGHRKGYETHIPAQQAKTRTHTRIPCPYGYQSRAPRPQAPSRQRPRTADAVTHSASVTTTSIKPGLTSSESYRFKKENRLLDAAAFGRVFQKATRSRDKLFTVLCTRNNKGIARLGLAISRKHCRRATARNRIKRIVRESFREHQAPMAGLDIVVINQPAAASADNRQIFHSLEAHWRRCQKVKRIPQES